MLLSRKRLPIWFILHVFLLLGVYCVDISLIEEQQNLSKPVLKMIRHIDILGERTTPEDLGVMTGKTVYSYAQEIPSKFSTARLVNGFDNPNYQISLFPETYLYSAHNLEISCMNNNLHRDEVEKILGPGIEIDNSEVNNFSTISYARRYGSITIRYSKDYGGHGDIKFWWKRNSPAMTLEEHEKLRTADVILDDATRAINQHRFGVANALLCAAYERARFRYGGGEPQYQQWKRLRKVLTALYEKQERPKAAQNASELPCSRFNVYFAVVTDDDTRELLLSIDPNYEITKKNDYLEIRTERDRIEIFSDSPNFEKCLKLFHLTEIYQECSTNLFPDGVWDYEFFFGKHYGYLPKS